MNQVDRSSGCDSDLCRFRELTWGLQDLLEVSVVLLTSGSRLWSRLEPHGD